MNTPEDPYMLMSMLNMKLRDGDYEDLKELLDSLNLDEQEVINNLEKAGFSYIHSIKQFR